MPFNIHPAILPILFSPIVLFAVYQYTKIDWLYSAILLFIGGLFGATLNYFQYGFSSSFRSLFIGKRTIGMRAIIWLLAIAIILFAPLLAMQNWQDQSFTGFIRPLSLSIPIGAFIFGIGMQIGCGCTSGTLNRVGQLQALSISTLLFMVIGGTVAALSFEHWRHLPALEPFAFQHEFGFLPGLVIQLLILFTLYRVLEKIENRHHSDYQVMIKRQSVGFYSHPYFMAAISLAFLNASLLLISGSPWSISSIFPYWGSQLIDLLSLPLDWQFWDYTMENTTRMHQGLFENSVSLTTMGVILGAFLVSLFRPRSKVPISIKGISGSVIGGLIMGFGAVLASGCNIGAFFSGIASGSFHGWVWFIFALLGNMVGVVIRKRLV